MDYKRFPIKLDEHTFALIKIYSRLDYLEDCWTQELDEIIDKNSNYNNYKKSAKQFIEQLEGRWCYAFMEELIIEIIKTIKKETCAKVHFEKTKKRIMDEIIK